MAQHSWTYADNTGFHYNIGLYHGKETGHVMVYCNKSIIIIDFNIRSQKKYSFYVGEEFFELFLNHLDPVKNEYSYELKINKDIMSPLNKVRKENQRKYNLIALLLGIVIFGSIIIASWIIY